MHPGRAPNARNNTIVPPIVPPVTTAGGATPTTAAEDPQRAIQMLQISRIVQGQQQRNIAPKTRESYLAQVKCFIEKILILPDELKEQAFECNPDGSYKYHRGDAAHLIKLKLPIAVAVITAAFSLIAIDPTMARKKKRSAANLASASPSTARAIGNNNGATAGTALGDEDGATEPSARRRRRGNNSNVIIDLLSSGDANPAKNIATVCAQTYSNYRSAVKWWHETTDIDLDKIGVPWPDEVARALKVCCASYKRDVGDKKRRGVMDPKEGKSPYDLQGYKILCIYFSSMKPDGHQITWNEGMFAGLFTKMSVNTIGRSDNIDDMLLSNFDWKNDAMVIRFSTTKTDQGGDVTDEDKRIFANPFMPEVCVILQLAVYTWCKRRTGETNDDRFLFNGSDQNKRYYNILIDAVMNKIPLTTNLGCNRADIGTHSNRKFAESTSVSKIDGPSRTQVCLRAGQGVGRTQDCYMFSEEDGDALVGRTVAQLLLTADQFDVLPPHFGTAVLQELVEYGWDNILEGFSHYPDGFQRVIPYLFASLVFHWSKGNLQRLYPAEHPIFKQRIFTHQELVTSLAPKVILVHGYCLDTNMSASGVPGMIVISREIRAFRAEYKATRGEFSERVSRLEDQMMDAMEAMPERVVEAMLKRIKVKGAVPIQIQDIRDVMREMLADSSLFGTMTAQLQSMRNAQQAMMARLDTLAISGSGSSSGSSGSSGTNNVAQWPINHRNQSVPDNFKYPSYTAATMWQLWFFGDPSSNLCPLKNLVAKGNLINRTCKSNSSRTRKVMTKLTAICIDDGLIRNAGEVSRSNYSSLFDHAYPKLMLQLYENADEVERRTDRNVNTLANRMNELKI